MEKEVRLSEVLGIALWAFDHYYVVDSSLNSSMLPLQAPAGPSIPELVALRISSGG